MIDFKKFAQIALKDIQLLFTDRATLMIIIVTPFILTFVIGAAFGGISGGDDSPIKNIPVVVVNRDKGTALGPQQVNFGQNITDTLQHVGDLLSVQMLNDETEAKALVT